MAMLNNQMVYSIGFAFDVLSDSGHHGANRVWRLGAFQDKHFDYIGTFRDYRLSSQETAFATIQIYNWQRHAEADIFWASRIPTAKPRHLLLGAGPSSSACCHGWLHWADGGEGGPTCA